jgi:hypothetical protein
VGWGDEASAPPQAARAAGARARARARSERIGRPFVRVATP